MNQINKIVINEEYIALLNDIKKKIVSARIKTARSVNKALIQLYWGIGKSITEKQAQQGWGQSVVEKLALDLAADLKGFNGFSANNLWRIRNFYLAYKDTPKLARLVQEIPWGQNIVILQMVKDVKEREYYIRATSDMGMRSSTQNRKNIKSGRRRI